VTKGKRIAAHLLEADESDVDFANGSFAVTRTDRRISFAEVANAAYVPQNFAFRNGAHVGEIAIDPQTGRIEIVGYWAVDDIGTVINPMIVHGQIHGGIAQGIGQALLERCAYDGDGQLVTGSFMDYALPRANELSCFVAECDESQPCTHNPLGAKGCG